MIKTVSIIVLNEKGKILALRRSENKKWYPKMWDIISGKFEKSESPDDCFKRELFEETGISIFRNIKKENPYIYKESGREWLVHPYCCQTGSEDVRLNSEHSDYKWMTISEILNEEHADPLRTELAVFYDVNEL